MPAVARARKRENGSHTSWDRARSSVVVPIGVIVAVAIVCIVVAVLSSAQRADEVARRTRTANCSDRRWPTTARACCAKSKASPPPNAAVRNIRRQVRPELGRRARRQLARDVLPARLRRHLRLPGQHRFTRSSATAPGADHLVRTVRPRLTPCSTIMRGSAPKLRAARSDWPVRRQRPAGASAGGGRSAAVLGRPAIIAAADRRNDRQCRQRPTAPRSCCR